MASLNHVAFGARDPAVATAALARLGFACTAPSRCAWEIGGRAWSAAAGCVVFPGEYLDFIESRGERWDAHLARSPLYAQGFAATAIVLSGPQAPEAFAAVASSAAPGDAYPIRRQLADASDEISYDFVSPRASGLPLALIRDAEPEALRRPEWLAHPNGALGIARVHVRVPSLDDAAQALARPPLSLACERNADGRLAVDSWLALHESPDVEPLASISTLLPRRDRAALLALEVRVESLSRLVALLDENRVRHAAQSHSLAVDPSEGFGAGFVFSE